MAGKSMDLAKEHLKDSDLFPKVVHYSEKASQIKLALYIKNYSELKQNVIYYVSANICECKFINKLIIANETLFVFLSTDLIMEKPVAAIQNEEGRYSFNYDIKLRKNLLILEFCNKAIMDPKNNYLTSDSLLIEFNCLIKRSQNSHSSIKYNSLQNLKDISQYCNDLKETSKSPKMHDLLVQVGKVPYLCHKEILVTFSEVFADILQDPHESPNKKARVIINDDPLFFHHVLSFIYYQKLDNLDEEFMKEMYRIANILHIESLIKKCKDYFGNKLIAIKCT